MYAVMHGEQIRRLREEKGLNKREFANAAGISESTARKVERSACVQRSTAWKVARVFGLEARNIAHPASQPYLRLVR